MFFFRSDVTLNVGARKFRNFERKVKLYSEGCVRRYRTYVRLCEGLWNDLLPSANTLYEDNLWVAALCASRRIGLADGLKRRVCLSCNSCFAGQTGSEEGYWPRIRDENIKKGRYAGEGADRSRASRTRRTSRSRSSMGGEDVL